ncbi:MAG: CapA family protein, partial [Myxococcales bacterium]|nr:CapA family protein [Myxococcales bacterium]
MSKISSFTYACVVAWIGIASSSAVAQYKAPTTAIRFRAACDAGLRVTLAFTSDILLHRPVRLSAALQLDKRIVDKELRVATALSKVFHRVTPLIKRADLAYANLEGVLARSCSKARIREKGYSTCKVQRIDPLTLYDEDVYTTFPRFNYPPSTARMLKMVGFDVIGLANNHMTDRYSNGIDMTLDELAKVGMPTVGAVRLAEMKNGEIPPAKRYLVVRKKGIGFGFLAYTYGTNSPDRTNQVMSIAACLHGNCESVMQDVKRLRARPDVDVVIVGLHWGTQHKEIPTGRQVQVGRMLIEAGADLVVGGHPHRLQPWEMRKTRDGREGLIMYSLGDLSGSWTDWFNRVGVIVYVGFTKSSNGAVRINGARVLPLYHYKTIYPPTKRPLYQTFPLSA